jgi:hypothetical protein
LSVTNNIASVDVDHHERYAGLSRYGLVKSISLWLKMATSFSIVPLRLTSLAGICYSKIHSRPYARWLVFANSYSSDNWRNSITGSRYGR